MRAKPLRILALVPTLLWAWPALAAPDSAVTSWLSENKCTHTLWNSEAGMLGHGAFHPEIPLSAAQAQARYGQTGQRVSGPATGADWCTAGAAVGDGSAVGCWLANAGLPSGYVLTSTDAQDLGHVDCGGLTACAYIRYRLGGDRACSKQEAKAASSEGPAHGAAFPECLSGACLPQCGCTSAPESASATSSATTHGGAAHESSCGPSLSPVPPDVRETAARLQKWLPSSRNAAIRASVARLQAWLAHVDCYQPRAQSSAAMPLVLEGRPAR